MSKHRRISYDETIFIHWPEMEGLPKKIEQNHF